MAYESDPWQELRRFTQARIALGRSGASLPTRALLEFGLAHAQARDAVHACLDTPELCGQLSQIGCRSVLVRSAAATRGSYLSRPDEGRRLEPESRLRLSAEGVSSGAHAGSASPRTNAAFVIADGLSAVAVVRHAVPVLREVFARQEGAGEVWRAAPVVVAEQARVALGDEIGQILNAEQVVVLIGERPGLSAHDSLGLYLTYAPQPGRKDAERNCISNVRTQGLSYAAAAHRLVYLMSRARQVKLTGIALKDASELPISLRSPDMKGIAPCFD